MKENIIEKYEAKILGETAAGDGRNYLTKDFIDERILVGFFSDLAEHQVDLTKDGFRFLEEYYGLPELVKIIKANYPNFENQFGTNSIEEWLKEKGEFSLS